MKYQKIEFQPDLCTREANAAFAQDLQPETVSFKSGFKEGREMPFTTRKRVAGCLFGFLLLSLAASAFGQAEPSPSAAVHPIPSAPKRSYVPASFSAQPELQCKVYPARGTPSQGITVFTDDDGYARFHAVRADAGDAVQRLAADCTTSAGMSSSYSVDLTSADTFTPRPLNLAKERGTDRPALEGDPLSYTQAELIQAGYGLRPDPKDTAPYARWLAAASMPGRMLDAKRPRPIPASRRMPDAKRPTSASRTDPTADLKTAILPRTVVTTTGPWWVGSTLNGAPTYVASEAIFNVPTPIPGGDETTGGTQISIWNGVEGSTAALIQGGVGMLTTFNTASFWTWREYCCGDPDSDGYGGAFTPKPGDSIYSIEWYCDSQGNPNPNGGYGCTYLQDFTTGAILNCTLAHGSPCWSVQAAPAWITSFGTDADFVIEDQTPQILSAEGLTWNAATAYKPNQLVNYQANPYICLVANTNQTPSNHTGSGRFIQYSRRSQTSLPK